MYTILLNYGVQLDRGDSTKANVLPYLAGRCKSEHIFAPKGGYCIFRARKRRCAIAKKPEKRKSRSFSVLVDQADIS